MCANILNLNYLYFLSIANCEKSLIVKSTDTFPKATNNLHLTQVAKFIVLVKKCILYSIF